MKKLLLILILLASSCAKLEVKTASLDSFQQAIREEFVKIESKEDREYIYTTSAGAAAFLHKAKLDNSENFDVFWREVASDYSWQTDKYPNFNKAVTEFMLNRGYDEPRDLSKESDREWLAKIFEDLAAATKE